MKHRTPFVLTCWWIILLTMVGGFLLVYAPREKRVSDKENRMLAGAPEVSVGSVMSGEFMDGFENWLSDSFFARDSVINLSESLLNSIAFGEKQKSIEDRLEEEMVNEPMEPEEEEEAVLPEDIAQAQETKTPEVEPIDYTDMTDVVENWEEVDEAGEAEIDLNGKLAFYLKMTNGDVERLYTYTEKNVETVANMLNAYRDILPEDGTVHYMNIPFSGNSYRWTSNRSTYFGWGSNVEEEIQKYVKDGVYVHNIPALFEQPLDEGEYLYFRLDHHWTPRGAWMAVSDFMRKQGYPTVDYDEYNYTVYTDFYGSQTDNYTAETARRLADRLELMWPLLPARHYLVSKLTQLKETQLMDYERKKYTAFMEGTRGPWRLIETGYDTGRTALVICDSYGTAFTPYLMPYYDRILMTDLRPDYYDKKEAGASVSQYVEEYGVDDIYMVLAVVSGPNKQYSLNYMMKYLK